MIDANSCYHIDYVVALLNSSLCQWRFKLTSTNNNVGTNELKALPFRIVDFQNATERHKHDKIAELSRRACERARSADDAIRAARRQSACDALSDTIAAIDELIYELFDLTPSQIGLVQASCESVETVPRATVG